MTSTRPYLVRAFYDWIVDNDCTPYIVVDATQLGVEVPQEFVDEGKIVLNIALSAVSGLVLGDHAIEFQARFGGSIRRVYTPIYSVLAIYAKENGRGMVFAEDEEDPPPGESVSIGSEVSLLHKKPKKQKPGRPHLTVVK